MKPYTTLGFDCATARPMRPSSFDGGRPFVSRFHVWPASVLLKMPPSLKPTSTRGSFHLRRCRCHAPAYRMFGSLGSIARSFTPVFGLILSTCDHVLPPSVVLKMPRISFSTHS